MKKIGYAAGVFDLFHYGHVRMLKAARSMCDHLIVGVSSDELVRECKNKKPTIPFEDRIAVVEACRYVDTVVGQYTLDKEIAYKRLGFDLIFVGDDWHEKGQWKDLEKLIKPAKVVYIPYTKSVSSTLINSMLDKN